MSSIKPKFSLSGNEVSQKAGKQFTDREEFLEAFIKAIETKVKDEHKILMYYGIGGIGKTALRKELSKRLEEKKPETVWTVIDLDTPTYREQETSLFVLRNELNTKAKINFPTFDIAYTVYWQKTHPQTPLTKENFPLLTGANVVAGIMSTIGEIPYISFIPKITMALVKGQNVFREWWKKRGEKELKNLPNLEPKEISERMPMFWASDLKDYLVQNNKKVVLFLDTFEALWENVSTQGGFFLRDAWIRELVSQLPEVLWVICGREKLRWEEKDEEWKKYIEEHLLGRLSDEDSKYFLKTCGVDKEDVQNVIVKASKGVPHFLDLAVDTYYEISSKYNREPETKDFAKTQHEVLERFLRYPDKTEIATLNVLSSARFWNAEIFKILVEDFKTGYPVLNMSELFRFSFITEGNYPDTWVMHDLMRESLQFKQTKDVLISVHKRLFDYYNDKLINLESKYISESDKSFLLEAYYHGQICLKIDDFVKWFLKTVKIFFKAAEWKFLIILYEDITTFIEETGDKESLEYSRVLINLSELYKIYSRFNEARNLLQIALNIRKKILGENHQDIARVLNNLAELYGIQEIFSEAIPLLEQAIEITKKALGEDHIDLANSLTNLAILNLYSGKYRDAELLYKKALNIRENSLGKEHIDVGSALSNLATLYLTEGNYSLAETYFFRALDNFKKNLGEEHPLTADAYYNISNLYLNQGNYFQAEPLCIKVIEIYEKVLGKKNNDYADAENNLAILYYQQKRYQESLPLFENALKIKKQILGNEHPKIARLLKELSNNYRDIGKFNQAEQLYKKSLLIYEKIYGKENLEFADTSSNLGRLYSIIGLYNKAKECFEKALKIYDKTVTLEHPDAAKVMNNFALYYCKQKEYDKALTLLEKALEINKKKLNERHPELANTINNIAIINYYKGNIDESEKLLKEALRIKKYTFNEEHPEIAASYNNIALIYKKQGKLKKAEIIYKKIIAIFQNSFGKENLCLSTAIFNYAELCKFSGKIENAKELFKKSEDINKKILGEKYIDNINNFIF